MVAIRSNDFGEAKINLAMTRLRLWGLTGARDEFLLLATVQNLKRLAKYTKPAPAPFEAGRKRATFNKTRQ